MGIFIIVTASWCGPCTFFKERLMDKFVKFLYDNVMDIEVLWYEVRKDSHENKIYDKFAKIYDNGGKVEFDFNEIKEYVEFFPQGVYKPINSDIYPSPIKISDPNEWKDILDIIRNNPDIFVVMNDGFSQRSSPKRRERRYSPRKRTSPSRRRWINFK